MAVVKQGMSDWSNNGRKMTSHSNYRLKFSERPLHVVRAILFRFDAI